MRQATQGMAKGWDGSRLASVRRAAQQQNAQEMLRLEGERRQYAALVEWLHRCDGLSTAAPVRDKRLRYASE